MKEKYQIEVAGITLTLVSEESEEYVNKLAEVIDKRLCEMIMSSKRVSKTEAAMFCALDYLDLKIKSEIKLRESLSQLKACDETIEALKHENDELRRLLGK